jgi:four helix bundle protein
MDAVEHADDLKRRTQEFALRIIRACESLPPRPAARVIGNQLLRCGTSVGANYRSARRARSGPDFISKIGIVLEEADECVYWLELLCASGIVSHERLDLLTREAEELVAIFAASRLTAMGKRGSSIRPSS